MVLLSITATNLKNDTSNILNTVCYERKTANVTRHGRVVAKLVPITDENKELVLKKNLDKYYGAIMDLEIPKRSISTRSVEL